MRTWYWRSISWFKGSKTGVKIWAASALAVASMGALVFVSSAVAQAHGVTMNPSPQAKMSVGSGSSPASSLHELSMGSAKSSMTSLPTPNMAGPGSTQSQPMAPSMTPSTMSSSNSICPNVVGATQMPDGMLMAPVPSGQPTPQEQQAASNLVTQVTQDSQKYTSLSAALAAGYIPITNTKARMVHYANWKVVESGDVLDPANPPSLMYANTVSGPVLVGVMFFGPGPCQPGPDIGGPLTQWHAHSNLCLDGQHQVVGITNNSGTCSNGAHNTQTLFMLHVWTAPSIAAQFQFQADIPPSALTPIIQSGKA